MAPPAPRSPAEIDGAWDEMVTGGGGVRPHWLRFLSAHGPFTAEALAERWEAARRLLFQNGVTYTVYAGGGERPWPLDPLPLLLPEEEWQALAAGLRQRARLLEALLADLYGPQTLVREGVIPPVLLHADPGFLRPCHGLPAVGGLRLPLLAVDLLRGGDGAWRVLACRTQAPVGAGYALENRAVLSQTQADSFRACNVDRLAPFFEQLRQTLARIAPRRSGPDGAPRAVLLTPGPYNEAYFEHAYLARWLGLTLAEGADLTVRDQALYLKTLAGLERVDVVLRRVDDLYCDPLELRLDSTLGIPGLVQAVRAGTVAVANALGSGLADSPALLSRTASLCRRLLDEAPLLDDVPTLWGGDADGRAGLLAGLDRLLFLPAFSAARTGPPLFGPDLSAAGRTALAAAIAARPQDWIAQAPLPPSTAPVWREGRVDARPLVLRAFLCAREEADGWDWQVMPGGLARISADGRHAAVSLQQGTGAKDVWVLGSGTPLRRRDGDAQRDPAPVAGDLPSRAADHLFWVGRYAERADGAVRLLRAAAARLADDSRPGAQDALVPLLRLLGWSGMVPLAVTDLALGDQPGADGVRAMRQALRIVADPQNPGGLHAAIGQLRRAAVSVRDRLPPDGARLLAVAEAQLAGLQAGDVAGLQLALDDLAATLAALAGLELDGMSRGPGWRFLVLGRRLERAIALVGRVQGCGLTHIGPPLASPLGPPMGRTLVATLEVLLELAQAGPAYRERHPAGLRREPALALLLADAEHPRSLLFQLEAMERQLARLPEAPAQAADLSPTAVARSLLQAGRTLATDPDAARDPAVLARLVERLSRSLPDLSTLLSQAYFAHAFARPT